MSRPTVTEFKLPEAEHHRLDLLAEIFANDMAVAREHQRKAQEADQIARTKLTNAAERVLNETQADKLPEGKVPQGAQLKVDFNKRTISASWAAPQAVPAPRVLKPLKTEPTTPAKIEPVAETCPHSAPAGDTEWVQWAQQEIARIKAKADEAKHGETKPE
jgi:hypothetical protein